MKWKGPRRLLHASIVSVCWMHGVASPASALPRTWIGGSTNWDDAGNPALWDPADEPDADDEAIFGSPDSVTLGTNNDVSALTMSGGVGLNLNGFDLTVSGLVHLAGANTSLIAGGSASLLRAENLRIDNGAAILLQGGVITVDELGGNGLFDINAGAILAGTGTINFTDAPVNLTSLIINDGVITATSDPIGGVPPAGTLLLHATSPNARINLDGTAGGIGVVTVQRNQTLDINMNVADAFGGSINLFHNSTLDISTPWMLDVGSISVDNGLTGAIPADVAYISGGTLTQTGGTTTVVDPDGALQFNAPFVLSAGSLSIAGRVILNSNSRVSQSAMIGGAGSLIVGSGGTLVVDDDANIDVQVRNEGVLSPAGDTTAGQISMKSFAQSAGGTLRMQLGGVDPSDHDRILVAQDAVFGGELRVGGINSFSPIPGDSFTLLSYQGHSGMFSIVNELGIAGLTLTPTYGSTALTLTAGWYLPGDADLNGMVDLRDLMALANHWLGAGDWLGGDFDGNGLVDRGDLTLLAQHWQAGVNVAEAIEALGLPPSSVPEPSAIAGPVAALLTFPRRRRR